MSRSIVLALSLFLAACAAEPGGSVTLSVVGGDGLPELFDGPVVIDWDGENDWTRQVTCETGGDFFDSTWSLAVYDLSLGDGLELDILLLDYDGPGDYTRDEFQPRPAFTITYNDPDTGLVHRFGLESGGTCVVAISEGGRDGDFDCLGVPLILDAEPTAQLIDVSGAFSCNRLEQQGGNDREVDRERLVYR